MTFKFEVEERDHLFFCVDREAEVELAPVFTFRQTALELGHDCTADTDMAAYKTGIPIVAVDSPFPRGETPVVGTASGLHKKADPTAIKRHRLNPS